MRILSAVRSPRVHINCRIVSKDFKNYFRYLILMKIKFCPSKDENIEMFQNFVQLGITKKINISD